jgi:serine-type D-Ala-D-Ala carboxypeptidase/endopeptidase (penicillin-binding protein 4)
MRRFLAGFLAVGALFGALAAPASAQSPAQRSLGRALRSALRASGGADSAQVVDMTTGKTLFSSAAGVARWPASVEKIYTTSTALLRFGPNTRLSTRVLGLGQLGAGGAWHGTLFLKGGGDPTLGSKSFDHFAYGTGATMQRLVANLIHAAGIRSISGQIVGDESHFDSLRGTPPYGYQPATDVEGVMSALIYNRGLADPQGTAFQNRPALFATQQFVSALKAAGVRVPIRARVYTGAAPPSAQPLASVVSPRMATLVRLTNTPSDNFFAEMLLKGLGASFGGAGSTAAGAAVVRAQLADFGVHPQLDDGSGLSRTDLTTPRQVVTVLERMSGNPDFTDSLAIGGETGTLQDEMRGTIAQGNCIGKTGTLRDVANLAGYCTGHDGHKLVFAFLMNRLASPSYGHALEANMAVAVAKYDG